MTIDLNADLGEGIGNDAALLSIVTSASIACGGHAGNAETMRTALLAAKANAVRVGAHPGFADPEHFGRRRLELPVDEIIGQIVGQVEMLEAVAAPLGVPLAYIKLHGALANMAAEDDARSDAIFGAVARRWPTMAALVLENSAQERAAERSGMAIIREAYADRGYLADGMLAPRSEPGAVIEDTNLIVERCLRLALHHEIVATDGTVLASRADSICLHGDTSSAVEHAIAVRTALEGRGLLTPIRQRSVK